MRIVIIIECTMGHTALQDADIVARKMEESMAQTSGPRHEPSASPVSCTQRKRITTAELMQGAREIIVFHHGEEYLLRITKSGKLILTK
jgi:hemin uptake protein HemP